MTLKKDVIILVHGRIEAYYITLPYLYLTAQYTSQPPSAAS
jgi:hypothetical protein